MTHRSPSGTINFVCLVSDKGLRLLIGLVVGFALARHLGAARFGLLNYALALAGLFSPLAELGLDAVARRRLIANPETAGGVLAAVLRLRLLAGAVAYAGLAAYLLGAGNDDAGGLLLILGLTLFQPAGSTADLWLQANLRARLSVMMNWGGLLAGTALRLWFIRMDAELAAFAWVAVVEGGVSCGLLWWGARRSGLPALKGDGVFGPDARELLGSAWWLLLSGLSVMLYMRVDMVMLRSLAGDQEAGVYAAAVRLSELGYFVPIALAASVLPALLRKKAEGARPYAEAMQHYYDLNAALAYGIIMATVWFAKPLIALVYGPDFAGAADVLRWHAWAALFVFLGVARTQFMVNESRLIFNLLTTVLGALVNIILNLWWIPTHGALGAAWATLAAYGVAAWAASWLHPATRATAAMQTRALLIPVLGWRYLFRR